MQIADRCRRDQAVAQAGEVARAAALERQARQRPGDVRHAAQGGAQALAQLRLIREERDRGLARENRVEVGQRAGDALGEEPRAAR